MDNRDKLEVIVLMKDNLQILKNTGFMSMETQESFTNAINALNDVINNLEIDIEIDEKNRHF